ncbi:sensor domain-containing diguanylate cyclase [Sporosarcina beigongshangi]|uniref:sensor domain-containing diguanylate cyclase n=1 Tax=Sporosarcina beigongshangi TaxID=2782538 RepID=UPI001E656E1A|nr:sensor domain-containing diguanylate cyclase [Sporosarcina beigongshangi]
MSAGNKSTIKYFIMWIMVVPFGMYMVFVNYPPVKVDWTTVAIFAIFSFLAVYYPIKKNESPMFLVTWLTIPAFLMYGLFVEIIVMQLAILATLFNKSGSLTILLRFFFNSVLFLVLSILGAIAFYAVGGEVGSLEFWQVLVSVAFYQVVHTAFNDLALRIYARYKRIKTLYTTNDILADYVIMLVIIPMALTLYFMIYIVGTGAFLLLVMPFFLITFIARLYNSSEKINNYLQQASQIGQELSGMMTEKEVIDQFIRKVSNLFDVEFAYLFDYNEDWLEVISSYEYGQFKTIAIARFGMGQGLAGRVLQTEEPVIYSSKEEWEAKTHDYMPDEIQSVICIPIARNQKIEGVLLLGSKKKSAFLEYQVKIMDLLCSYFTVSVEKARYMEEAVTKNERCALTGLYNYRYLEEQLTYQMGQVTSDGSVNLSVVMLDIDYFKKINDEYGHQSGNDILYILAKKLEAALPEDGIVGRYGGEEFVFILPGMTKSEAYDFAEDLRAKIGGHNFLIVPDLGEDKYPTVIHITCSIGVSSAPQDTDEAMTLLRNADRALYIGAKQAGRNRVAMYVK